METSEQLNELAKALSEAQAEFPPIPKTSSNPFFKSKYADLADVKAIADPIATKHGLTVSQWPSSNEKGDTLITFLLHTSGQFIQSEMQLHPVKVDPQGQGSAITYGRRYAYSAALGLVTDEDDDGNAGAGQQQKNQQQRPEPKSRSGAGGQAKRDSQPVVPKAQPTGINMQKLMLKELDGPQRQGFLAWKARVHPKINMTEVPKDMEVMIEKAITGFATGEIPKDETSNPLSKSDEWANAQAPV